MAFYKKNKYFKTVKIWLSNEAEELNEDEQEAVEDNHGNEKVFVELREPSTEEAFSLREDDEEKAIEAFHKLIPAILIDHNFYEDETETKKLSNEEVADVLYASYSAFFEVLTKYTSRVFRPAK